jgi:1,2-phenylacetyl-CoA epoxidase PaaB subunit
MKKIIVVFLVWFLTTLSAQDKYYISNKAPSGRFEWHDPNPPSAGVTGYLLYLGYPPAGVIRDAVDTSYVENFSETTPDSFTAVVTAVNAFGQSEPSNMIWVIRSDTIEYIPIYDKTDIPLIANYIDVKNWIIAEPKIRRSKISFDDSQKKIYLFGSIGPAFVERFVDIDSAAIYKFSIKADRYQGSEFYIRLSKDFTTSRTDYIFYPDEMQIPLMPGRHLICLEAMKNTVVLWGDPVLTITRSDRRVPLPVTLRFIRK